MPATPPLFLLDALPPGELVLLAGDEGRHAGQVLRIRPGERAYLSDGQGVLLDCLVRQVRPDGVELAVQSRAHEPAACPRMTVVQALPKGDRGELAVATMTELGVDAIVPWQAARSVAQWAGTRGEKAREKWRRTAREAAKQSRRPWVPEVAPLATTAHVAGLLAGSCGLVLHESAPAPLATVVLPDVDELVLVVGPEGGISAEEVDAFVAAGAQPVRLGSPVLRTSTAGVAALAALSVRLGRWN